MARLIDAEAFLEAMEEYVEYSSFDHYKEEPSINISFETLEEIVAEQPTAYDVDAVVKQLEDNLTCEDFGTCGYCQNRWCPRELLDADEAIEIVKAGGIDGN